MSLQGRGLHVRRGERQILAGVDIELRAGELVLLCGRNGAGKSTLLRVLLGAEPAAAGEVRLASRPLASWPARERARQMAFVPQDPDTPFEFTGRELVAMGRHPHRGTAALQPEDVRAIENALVAVDALSFADRAVTSLSGGEQRRIAVARALATEAGLMLLDEPTSNLDLEHALSLAGLLRELADRGRGLLVASHDINLLAPFAHRVIALHDGRSFADGPPESALSTENVAAVFGVAAAAPSGYFPRDFRPLRR
jgi:iron complex transport system ATP-binding protein